MKYLLIALLLCTGCAYTFKRQPATQAKVHEAAREEVQASAIALDRARQDIAAARALAPGNAPLACAEYSAGLAYRLSSRAESLLGPPVADQHPRVQALLSTNAAVRATAEASETVRIQDQTKIVAQDRAQTATLIAKGALYEQEHNRGIVSRAWHWAVGTLGIGGLIALCVFFPAAIPIIGQLVGWLVSKIPKLSSWLGVVGVRSYQRCVTAIQEIKQQAALSGHTTAEELARRVASENTGKDAGLVAHVKSTLDYDSALRKD